LRTPQRLNHGDSLPLRRPLKSHYYSLKTAPDLPTWGLVG